MKTSPDFHHSPSHSNLLPGVAPDPDAQEELTWFFNGAIRDLERPLERGCASGGLGPGGLWPFEVRAEIVHAASRIHARLRALPEPDLRVLEALYTERVRPRRVERALGWLAGPVAMAPHVVAAYARAITGGETSAPDVAAWLDERLAQGGASRAEVHAWKRAAAARCAAAIDAYLAVRGGGPSAVPFEVLG